jgi:S1-C subfamily serine protease
LVTNAHSVTFAVGGGVYVKRRADDTRFEARVLAVGTECDVALLTVDDDAFWESVVPLELGAELPELQASLAVVGYPIGGASLAISAGVVSRVGMVHYSHGAMSLFCIQSDAAINSGNSGGPVLDSQGACVGIAFQSLTGDAQNVGYIVPSRVVLHFLQDFARSGSFNSFPSLNITWQELESKALKRAHGLGEREKGVLVRSVATAAAEAAALRPDDILQRIDGVEVGSDGTVPFRHGERVAFASLISSKFCGDEVELSLLRAGERLTARVALSHFQHLVPPHNSERKPTYLQVGGLVFTRLVDPYLAQRYGSLHSAPVRLLKKSYYGLKSRPDEEVVVLSNVLACAATAGYDSTVGVRDGALAAFNGEKVWNMLGLARAVGAACAAGAGCEFLRFDLETGKTVVLEVAAARRCTGEVAESNSMKASMSADLAAALARGGGGAAE